MLAVAPCASSWLAAGDAVCRLTVQLVPALCLLGCLLLPHSVRPIWWPLVIVYLQLPAAHVAAADVAAAGRDPWWASSRCVTCSGDAGPRLQHMATWQQQQQQVRRLRVEATKQLILERLEMHDRPKVKTKSALWRPPPPMLRAAPVHDDDDHEAEFDHQAEETKQIIVVPWKMSKQKIKSSSPHVQVMFHIAKEMHEMRVAQAVLWTPAGDGDGDDDDDDDDADHRNATLVPRQVRWRQQDVTAPVNQQIDQQRSDNRYLRLKVANNRLLAVHQPYLIIHIDPHQRRDWRKSSPAKRRSKRSTSTPICGAGVTQCCRESLYVSFRDVGWDDWILQPHGFHAYYCRGSCRTATAASLSASRHASLLQRLIARDKVPGEARAHLSSCCVPTRLSSMTVFYSEENDVIKERVLSNMIVESCGCSL